MLFIVEAVKQNPYFICTYIYMYTIKCSCWDFQAVTGSYYTVLMYNNDNKKLLII